MSYASLPEAVSQTRIIYIAHVGFVLTGVVTVMLGLLLPSLSLKWSLNDAQAGNLFTAQFIGSVLGASASSRLTLRFGKVALLGVGFVLMALGVAGLNLPTWAGGVGSILLYGITLGLTIPTINLLVSESFPQRRASALNILNLTWSAGAVATPFVLSPLLRNESPKFSLYGLAFAIALIGLLVFNFRGRLSRETSEQAAHESTHLSRASKILFSLIALLFFIYVGAENAVGGWVASYAFRLDAASSSLWTLTPSVFWGALLLGRALAPTFLKFVTTERLILYGILIANVGVGVLLLTKSLPVLFVAVFLTGFGFAPVFPSLVALLPQCFGKSAARISGYFFAVAPFGGATIPFLTGWMSNRFDSLRVGLTVAALCCVLMFALQFFVNALLGRMRAVSEEIV